MKAFLSVQKILIATFTGLSFASLLIAQPSIANPNQPFDPQGDGGNNSLSNDGSDFSLFNLIHQANFGNLQWNSQEQNQQIDDAAAAFKAKQQELIGKQEQKPVTETPAVENKPVQTILRLNQN